MTCLGRDEWGACGSVPLDSTDKDEIAIHHSVSPNRLLTPKQEVALMRSICQQHMRDPHIGQTIAYSYLVCASGRCYVGRGRHGLPAATSGQNTGTWAICLIGDFRNRKELDAAGLKLSLPRAPTVEARRETRRLIELLIEENGAKRLGGHREFPGQSTECPGGMLLDFVEKWRDDFDLTKPERS